ncbi:MAG TPA: helix-turn-helix transcriptional regulator [Thermoanaerobaculia bacterium]|nr:helix-turn-helix transcriptional regulator [Thermoanaerobaculia bacterium]
MKDDRTASSVSTLKHAVSAPIPEANLSRLTSREAAILSELFRGRTNPQIASTLGISRETVKTHVSHILCKLGLRTRDELTRRRQAAAVMPSPEGRE